MAFYRSWIDRNRFDESKYLTEEYKIGGDSFIKFACEHLDEEDGGLIRCPCRDFKNKYFKIPNAVKIDLYRYDITHWYTIWDQHGEKDVPQAYAETSTANIRYKDDDMHDAHDMLRDFGEANRYFENVEEKSNTTTKEFYKMMHNTSEPIYPNNVNFIILEFVNKLLHFKSKHNCSNNDFDELLHLIRSVLPNNHKLPPNYYVVRKMLKGLNIGYEKIDACENDCMLFYKENREKTHCDICNEEIKNFSRA